MPLLTEVLLPARVEKLLCAPEREAGLEKQAVESLELDFAGILTDCHKGLTRAADSRTLRQYARGTEIRNVRQLTLISVEELADIAKAMGHSEMKPEWLGGNVVTSGIPDLTLLPPSSRLQFPSGATIVIDMENAPCRQVADVIQGHCGEGEKGFVAAAKHKRGLTAWVERPGRILVGDPIRIWIPPQRIWQA